MLDGFNGDDDKWGKVYNYEYKINTVLQEIAENDVDQAHFPKVHGSFSSRNRSNSRWYL